MSFMSATYIIIFPFIFLVYYASPVKFRWIVLLILSYFFYVIWDFRHILLLLIFSFFTYCMGIVIDTRKKDNKLCVKVAIFICLGILGIFRYTNFLIYNINSLLRIMRLSYQLGQMNILFPIGMSFYVFRAISYLLEIHRGNMAAERNFGKYALYIAFFPQMMAGPIEKPQKFLMQLSERKIYNEERITCGLLRYGWGLFEKLVIADRLKILVDTVFDDYTKYKGVTIIIASLCYTLQIMCDFEGYSNMAIGIAETFGYKTTDNFLFPYFSKSIKEFWRRWHISLSSWFRNYLYIPMGGNRKGKLRQEINLMIVFLVSGLWHGANWSFVFWGGVHGLYQVAGDLLQPVRDKMISIFNVKTNTWSYRLGQRVMTFSLVSFAWIFFRAESLTQAIGVVRNIFYYNPSQLFNGSILELGLDEKEMIVACISILVLLGIHCLQYSVTNLWLIFCEQNIWFRWMVYYMLIFSILIFGTYGSGYSASSFIYQYF